MPKVTYKLDDETAAQIDALGVPLDGFIQIAIQEKLARDTLDAQEPPARVIALPDGTQVVTNAPVGTPYAVPLPDPAPSPGNAPAPS